MTQVDKVSEDNAGCKRSWTIWSAIPTRDPDRMGRFAAPFGPGLEAAEWPTGTKRRSVLATAGPDGQGCGEPLSSLTLDVL